MEDPYKILGIDKTATADEVRDAYRRKAKETHPDLAKDDGAAFRKVKEAYDILGDPDRRARYDATGTDLKVPSPSQTLQSAWSAILDHGWHRDSNLIKETERTIKEAIAKRKEQVKSATKEQARIERILGRIKRKADCAPFLEEVLESQLQPVRTEIITQRMILTNMAEALKLLAGYDWRNLHELPENVSA
jgi:curved DNA-binding protein CbpA